MAKGYPTEAKIMLNGLGKYSLRARLQKGCKMLADSGVSDARNTSVRWKSSSEIFNSFLLR